MTNGIFSEEEIARLFGQGKSEKAAEETKAATPAEKPLPAPGKTDTKPPSPFHTRPQLVTAPPNTLPPSALPPIPSRTSYRSRRRLTTSLAIFVVTFFVSFVTINSGAFGARFWFWWKTDFRGESGLADQTEIIPVFPSPVPTISPQTFQTPLPTPTPPASKPSATSTKANHLTIPKIAVNAPVVWNSDPARILEDLRRGVAHYSGTSLPNERNGNVFITGHSTNYVWEKGKYNRVFANLDKLVVGDLIALTTDNKKYIYRVKESLVVRPTEVGVLDQTPTPILSLMTCTPIGTNLRRLVVRAELIQTSPL